MEKQIKLNVEIKKINFDLWDQKIKSIDQKYNSDIFEKIVKKSNKMAVLVEPRKHIHLSGVLKNFCSKLGMDWSMTIFVGNNNFDFVKNIIGNSNIKIIKLNTNNLSIEKYSELLLNKNFWNQLDSEKILIFQTDTLLSKNNI